MAAYGELLSWPSVNRGGGRAGTIKVHLKVQRYQLTYMRGTARSRVRTLNYRGRNISVGTRLP